MASIHQAAANAKNAASAPAPQPAAAPAPVQPAAAPAPKPAGNDIQVAAVTATMAATTISQPAASTNGAGAQPAAAPATDAKAADAKAEEESAGVMSAIEGLHPKDAEAQVEKSANASIYQSAKTFDDLPLSNELKQGVVAMKFTRPSKIQAEALPIILAQNRPNFIGQAHHGSGKTASYSLAMLSRVDENKHVPQAICVVPVRELAIQVFDVLSQLGKYTKIKIRKAIPEEAKGKVTEQVVVGTPGTLLAKFKHGEIDAKTVVMFVADEADQMISRQGLGDQTLQIKEKVNKKGLQVLLFSATFPPIVKKFAAAVAPNAVDIKVKREELSLDAIKQFWMHTGSEADKYQKLVFLYSLLNIGQAIVFVGTVKTAKELTNRMRADNYQVSLLHGKDMSPKERDTVMKDFRTGKTTVLVTTNVLARGIDVLSVTLVVNYDVPLMRTGAPDPETYIHRIGRSGRFGRPGVAINFVHDAKSTQQLAEIATTFNCPITELSSTNWEETEKKVKDALTGPTFNAMTPKPAQPAGAPAPAAGAGAGAGAQPAAVVPNAATR